LDKLDPAAIPAAERFAWQPKELVAVLGEHRQRHWGGAAAVAVSRDGKQIATGGEDGMIRFWDPVTCRERNSIRVLQHGHACSTLGFSPDGKRLAFGAWGLVGFCDLSGDEPVREKIVLQGERPFSRLWFTLDGKRLVGHTWDNLFVWDLAGERAKLWHKRGSYPGSGYTLSPCDMSADRRTLAYFSAEKTVTLLDIGGDEPRSLAVVPQPDPVVVLALSPDAKRLAVGASGKVRIWDVSGKNPVQQNTLEPGAFVLRFSPDGKRLVSGTDEITLWDLEQQVPSPGKCLPGSEAPGWINETGRGYNDLAFALDGRMLVAGRMDGSVRFWDLSGATPKEHNAIDPTSNLFTAPSTRLLSSFISVDGKRLVTIHEGPITRCWDVDQAAPAKLSELQPWYPAARAADGKAILLANNKLQSLAWCDLMSTVPRHSVPYQTGVSGSVARLMADGKTVAIGTERGEVVFLERTAGKGLVERSRLKVGEGEVQNLEVSPDGRMMAASVVNGPAIKLWDLIGDKPALRESLPQGSHLAFSPDSRMLAVSVRAASGQGSTTVWDVHEREPKQLAQWNTEGGLCLGLAFSPDSRALALATYDGKLVLRDAATGTLRKEWQLPGPIHGVTYAPDGRHLLTLNGNGTGYLLRLATADGLAVAPFTDADVQRIAALPAAEQVEQVRKELKRRNPGFDGKMEHKIEGGIVTELRIVTDQVTDISPIRVWSALRVLDCSGTWANKANGLLADLTPLQGMNLAGLTHLWLNNTKVTDAGMAAFKGCKDLRYLNLASTKVTDRGLANFKDCKNLTALELTLTKVTDAGLVYFKDCKDLRSLHLFNTEVGDAGLANFKDCKNLARLAVGGTLVSDAGLIPFKDCKALTQLILYGTKVSDAGLANFKGVPLTQLWIENTGITDLSPLQGMPLGDFHLTPKNITRGLDILRDMKSLKTIGIASWTQSWPAAEFWERYDKGEFK
jgi:WD40 repeat protein